MSLRVSALLVLASLGLGATPVPSSQFRIETSAVAVPVLVKSGGRPVADLTIDDFALTDNGVPQTITALQGVDAPLDVSIVIQQTMFVGGLNTDSFVSEIDDVRRLLRPTDRLEVVSASHGSQVLLPMGSPDRPVRPVAEYMRPCVTVYDAMVRVLARRSPPGRQQILLVLTEGEGSGGVVTREVALAAARRSQMSVSVLVMSPAIGRTRWRTWGERPLCAHTRMAWTDADRGVLRSISGISHPDGQSRAFAIEQRERLDQFAELTGGRRLQPAVVGRSLVGAVRPVLDEARHRYTLYFTPVGSSTGGWHRIGVSVRREGRFEVSARPGYEK